jgi:hypothetical protein
MRGAGPRVSDRTADPVPEFHCGRLGLVQQFGVSRVYCGPSAILFLFGGCAALGLAFPASRGSI